MAATATTATTSILERFILSVSATTSYPPGGDHQPGQQCASAASPASSPALSAPSAASHRRYGSASAKVRLVVFIMIYKGRAGCIKVNDDMRAREYDRV